MKKEKKKKNIITPSILNNYISYLLKEDDNIKSIHITGEVSNVKYHSNGCIYMSLKDKDATVSCSMFSSNVKKLKFDIKNGDMVNIIGNISLFVSRGTYNINMINIIKIEEKGDILQEFENLKLSFQKKGYFDNDIKKEIPKYPKYIGAVTASTGAAIEDIRHTVSRRYPFAKVKLFPAQVQGTDAVKSIVNSIDASCKDGNIDTLIVGRGGGNAEDLWAFNAPEVVEAIFNCPIPVISAVGHEIDFTIADFVADKRAPTPTAAAEMATPNIIQIKQDLDNIEKNIKKILNIKIQDLMFKNQNAKKVLNNSISTLIANNNNNLKNQKLLLDTLNPKSILKKGFSVTEIDTKQIDDVNLLQVGDTITTVVANGIIESKITKITKEKL